MRKYRQLTKAQRYQISSLLQMNISESKIASQLGVDKSTINREVTRNSTRTAKGKVYKPEQAHLYACYNKRHTREARTFSAYHKHIIVYYLTTRQWSPEQIKGYCGQLGIDMVSIEWIYQFIWKDKEAGGELHKHLRNGGRRQQKRGHRKDRRGVIKDRKSIEQRPISVDVKLKVGDWEVDTIIGKGHQGAVVTLVERKSQYTLVAPVEDQTASSVTAQIIQQLRSVKPQVRTITADNGKEFAWHQTISEYTESDFYFARPYHSWERGLNEYTNRLIRQYLPKTMKLDRLTEQKAKEVEEKLNNRPRKTLNYRTPKQIFFANFKPPPVALAS